MARHLRDEQGQTGGLVSHVRKAAWGNRGVALIVVLLILAVLAGLGTAMLVIHQLDKAVTRNFMDKVRARQVARAGMEFAIARLNEEIRTGRCMPEGRIRPSQYWGDVEDELGRAPPNERFPLDQATNPSFAIEKAPFDPYSTPDPRPAGVTMDGKRRGVSMAMSSGTYGVNGDVATLRVLDIQGRLHLNDGLHELGCDHRPVTENMRRMLNVLGSQGTIGIPDLGDLLINRRPPEGYRTRRHLLSAVGGDVKMLERFERFVTLHAWVDPNAVLPVPLSQETLAAYPLRDHYYRGQGEPHFRGGRGVDYKGNKLTLPLRFAPLADPVSHDVRVWGLDELKPTWIQVTKRAPVNVNAASREVLTALLTGLQGFFLLEQRRKFGDEAAYQYGGWGGLGLYHWMVTYYTYSPEKYKYYPWWSIWDISNYEVDEADDLGRLYTTQAITSSAGGTGDSGAPTAESIADEIIACRNREKSRAFDYTSAWFGGPFRSWRQFSAFCDNLVKVEFFKDQRPMFRDYPHQGADPWGWSANTVVSTIQQKFAAQAIADVLKANFNPNVHLNELNPDQALHLLVDKTDLIQNSTEFTFLPGGLYEIESLGRILRPARGQDALTAMDNEVVASSECRAQVQLFDLLRHSVQKDFYDGDFPRRTGASASNNNRGLESGPEPDNGTGPQECEFDGYVTLSTVGGLKKAHAKGTIEKTPFADDGEKLGSKLHAHFSLDDRLHNHADGPGFCDNLTRTELGNEKVENFSDPGGPSEPGPYIPELVAGGSRRLAWTFRVEPDKNLPTLDPRHSLDLRVDGVYSERHSGLAYWISPNVQPKDGYFQNGSACYWLKPSFFPELSGKSRQFLDLSVGAAQIIWGECPHEFTHYFYAGHDNLPGLVPILERSNPLYINAVAPTSMLFGMNWGGICTNTLNHEAHGHVPKQRSLVRGHGWTHVILRWKRAPQAGVSDCAIYVNGRLEADPADFAMGHAAYADVTPPNTNSFWYLRPDGTANSVRLGAPSRSQADYSKVWDTHMPYGTNTSSATAAHNVNANHIQNWSADSTIDEFYYWGVPTSNDFAPGLESALDLWSQGRYVAVEPGANEYLSKPLEFPYDRRRPPAPSRVIAPMPDRKDTTTEADEEAKRSARPRSSTQSAGGDFPAPHVDILAASWTLVTEESDSGTGEPFLYNHHDGSRVLPRLELSIKLGAIPISTVAANEKFSVLSGGGGDAVRVIPSQQPRYAAKFILENAEAETILLESVFLDDVTLLFTRGTEILSMEIE